jgi:hypothetical protein
MSTTTSQPTSSRSSSPLLIGVAWLAVITPLAWGVAQTLLKVAALFE